jgi:hypothetical protein
MKEVAEISPSGVAPRLPYSTQDGYRAAVIWVSAPSVVTPIAGVLAISRLVDPCAAMAAMSSSIGVGGWSPPRRRHVDPVACGPIDQGVAPAVWGYLKRFLNMDHATAAAG